MTTEPLVQWTELAGMVSALKEALGPRLASVVLYGSAARGEHRKGASDLNLVVVVDALDPAALEALSRPVRAWVRKGEPPPRLLTSALIAASLDIFPIEFLEIRRHHHVLHGSDPFAAVVVRTECLRLQCERELVEKLMRLREAYLETHASGRHLRRALTESYGSFVALFRGCLELLGQAPPASSAEVAAAFSARAGLDPSAFEAVARLRRGEADADPDLKALYSRYHDALARAASVVDAFHAQGGGETR